MSAPVIEIRGLEVFAHHGVHEHERRDGQTFLFDVRLECAPRGPSESDDLEDAVDYGAVARPGRRARPAAGPTICWSGWPP